jgi:O-antigen/teichoic acid export membrane protein
VEQGFFGLATQVGAACFLFTSAMTQLMTRELAVAWDGNDVERMRRLYGRVVPALYAITAYFCVFIAFHSEDVAWLIAGDRFVHGAAAMTIMVLYPMHQTYSQLTGAVFFATGQTRLYRNIGVAGMLLGLPVMLWLTAGPAWGGLGLGATGLALKTVALQALFVNVQIWFNSRLLSLSFGKLVLLQFAVAGVLAACAYVSSAVIGIMSLPRLAALLSSGALYTVLAAAMAWAFPQLCGLERGDFARLGSRASISQLLYGNRN